MSNTAMPQSAGTAAGYNVLAIVGFILAFVFSLAGLIVSLIALSQIKKTGERGHGLALVLQERAGLRAGYVQMGFDVLIVLASLTVVSPWIVLLSALGAVVLNLVLAMNHKAGRYVGHT